MLTKSICLMIIPLTALEEKQSIKINKLSFIHSKVITLQTENCNPLTLITVQKRQYTHIFLSSEIAIFKHFHEAVFTHISFQDRLILIAVNELYIAEWWKKWCTEYNKLIVLCVRVSLHILIFKVSVTLTSASLLAVQEVIEFTDDVHIIKTSIDWSEIYMKICKQSNTAISFKNL